MIHELLFALAGNTGDVIVLAAEDGRNESWGAFDKTFKVSPTVTFVAASERVAINRLVRVGYLYSWLKRAVQRQYFHGSLYVRALSRGIDGILAEYLKLLRSVEIQAYEHPGEVTVSHLQSRVRPYATVLSVVCTIVETIDSHNLIGGQILNLLHEHSCTGMPIVKDRISRLANRVLRVFYGQLASWVSHGILLDEYNEFMISQRVESFANNQINKSAGVSSSKAQPGGASSSTSSAYTSEDPHLITRRYNSVVAEHEWNTKYTLRLAMVPTSYVRYSFAQKCLFVGKAMMVLKQLDLRSVSKEQKDEYVDLCAKQGLSKDAPDETAVKSDNRSSEFNLLEFSMAIEKLQRETEFPGQPLEAALERALRKVNQRLWWLVVRVSDLPSHLGALKNYFLMWRGEFFHRFIVESRQMLDATVNTSSPATRQMLYHLQHDLNSGPLRRAAAIAGCDIDDTLFHRFGMRLYVPRFFIDDFGSAAANILTIVEGASLKTDTIMGVDLLDQTASVKKRPLVLCKDASQLSAAWHTELIIVEHGFETDVKANVEPGTTLSFVVQTDRLAAMPVSRSSEVGVETTNALSNALAVSFYRPEAGTTICIRATLSRQENEKKSGKISGPQLLGEVDVAMNPGESLQLRVLYSRAGSKSNVDSLSGNMEMEIFVQSAHEPVLKFRVSLRSSLQLAPTSNGGGAWVGLVGKTDANLMEGSLSFNSGHQKSQSQGGGNHVQNNGQSEISITHWRFVGNLPKNADTSSAGKIKIRRYLEGVYHVAWPLHLIVTQNALSQYNALFQFLFSIGHVSSALRGAWAILMQGGSNQSRFLGKLPSAHMHASRLRSRMSFLVDALQYYFHVDVIAAQWHVLSKVLADVRDFEKIQTAHAKFLASISRQCLLHVRTVRDALNLVQSACLQLCSLVERSADDLHVRLSQREISAIESDFSKHSSYLYLLLSGMSSKLRTRLDFNGHMSSAAAEYGSSSGVDYAP